VATQSNRVYYSLLAGEPVVLEDENDVWEFEYLADSTIVGYPTNGTGIVNLCEEKFIPVENLFDYEESYFNVQGQKAISYRATYDERRVTSNGVELLRVDKPQYSCQDTDGHDPRGDTVYYPEPSEDCWSQDNVFDNQYFSVKTTDMGAAYEYDDEEEGIDTRDWWVEGELLLKRNPFTVLRVVKQESYELGDSPSIKLVITNSFKSLDARVLFVVQPESINEEEVVVEDKVLIAGENTVTFNGLSTAFVGDYNVYVKVFLVTDKGVLDASATKLFSYEVVSAPEQVDEGLVEEQVVSGDEVVIGEVVNSDVGVIASPVVQKESLWTRFVDWIKNLFKG